jgi:putative FmdB family regulatory protein
MPSYTYVCDNCGAAAERFRSIARMRDPAPCPCGSDAHYQWVPTSFRISGGNMDTVIDGVRYEGSPSQVALQLRARGLAFKSDYIDKTSPQSFGIKGIDNREPPANIRDEALRLYRKAERAKTDGTASKIIEQATTGG